MQLFIKSTAYVLMLTAFLSTNVFAADEDGKYSGFGQETITRELTPQEKAHAAQKERAVLNLNLKNKDFTTMSTSIDFELDNTFSAKRQEKTYYCGPASALALINYRWATPHQSKLAADWDPKNKSYGMNTEKYKGTTSPDMARSINYHIGSNYYTASKVSDKDTLRRYIINDVGNDYPVNLLVDTKHFSWYNGKSFSHFVTVFGYHADSLDNPSNVSLDIADPHYSDSYFGKHYVEDFKNTFNAINANSWRENVVW
ncbi:C39 family peptidase [Paenibacillus thiaminolyticus]|uniref:C39 family peptidase n=1 Tax=Paenibacillus thiaminolyticus TaxID=49283 RepID=UPI0035A5C76D